VTAEVFALDRADGKSMPVIASARECYQALLDRNAEYEGLFFVGVRTTGVFCRPTCPARKPKFEHCEFFDSAQEALRAEYRPCKRCRPLASSGLAPDIVQALLDEVERDLERRWTERDFERLGVDPSTARRQFKKRFGMTFVEYARARRMGQAMRQISNGAAVIDAQLGAGYESGSGFREAFSKIIGVSPKEAGDHPPLSMSWLDTPLGAMVAIADDEALLLLEFADRAVLERQIAHLRRHAPAGIVPGRNEPIRSIEAELERYFAGQLRVFETPLRFAGTPFQRSVWETLLGIGYGETRSYSDLAAEVGRPAAVRAAAAANGANPIAIVVPCHRVIGKSGDLTGYGGGLARKRWLLQHESQERE
jgi:AraC family transcriptional regulator of adaptative response/methylated-DNA-[protein]-cysteine methyltransferase